MTTMELIERGIGHNCLSDAYELGRADVIDEVLHTMPLDDYQISFLKEFKEQKK